LQFYQYSNQYISILLIGIREKLVNNKDIAANIGKILGDIGKILVNISKILADYLLNISEIYNQLSATIGKPSATYPLAIILLLAPKANIFAVLPVTIG